MKEAHISSAAGFKYGSNFVLVKKELFYMSASCEILVLANLLRLSLPHLFKRRIDDCPHTAGASVQ
jgi:hypothetical protein